MELDEAKRAYLRARERIEQNGYTEPDATADLLRSYELAPSKSALLLLARSASARADYARAYVLFSAYLQRAEPTHDSVTAIMKELSGLEPHTARIGIASDVGDVAFAIGGVAVGRSPMRAAWLVNEGVARVSAIRVGCVDATTAVVLRGSGAVVLAFDDAS